MKGNNWVLLIFLIIIIVMRISFDNKEPQKRPYRPEVKPSVIDRSDVPILEALEGHWYIKHFDQHEYYKIVYTDLPTNKKKAVAIMMTWHDGVRGNSDDTSNGEILMNYHSIGKKQDWIIMTYPSFYEKLSISQYFFSKDKKTSFIYKLNQDFHSEYSPVDAIFVDTTNRSPIINLLPRWR